MKSEKLKTLALSELRRVAERTRLVRRVAEPVQGSRFKVQDSGGQCKNNFQLSTFNSQLTEIVERIPWRVWYVAASNGDCICGEECVTLAVYTDGPGAYPSRLVMFTASGQTRRLRDCCILRADDFILRI